jgi:hypothetical protein
MLSRYQEWLHFVFDRPVTKGGWYFDTDLQNFDADETEIALLVTQTMENCGRDLVAYSQDQVGYGLSYIFNNSCSDIVFSLMDESVDIALRLRAIASIKFLYRDYLTPNCAPILCAGGVGHTNQLSHICYMLWDVSPLAWWENRPNRVVFYDAVVDVLADALTSTNPACVESALHGLGHIHSSHIERVEKVISMYLRRNVFVAPKLKEYAQHASVGNVQ